MKKYLFIFKTEFINGLQYVSNFLIGSVSLVLILYIYLNLWKYLYSDPSSLINGYSYTQMVWYVLFTETIWSCIKGRKIVSEIADDFKTGNITYQLNKPYNYINYMISKIFATFTFKLFILLPGSLILGTILIGNIPNFNLLGCILAIMTGILGAFINILICVLLGLLSFFMEDSNPIYWIYSKIILVVGTLFPIEFMPKIIQPFLEYSPIFALNYGPAKLFIEYNNILFIKVIISQVVYIVLFYILANLIYKKGVKNINVNGG